MFCDKFKKLRLKNDYTQAELAKKLNVSAANRSKLGSREKNSKMEKY